MSKKKKWRLIVFWGKQSKGSPLQSWRIRNKLETTALVRCICKRAITARAKTDVTVIARRSQEGGMGREMLLRTHIPYEGASKR